MKTNLVKVIIVLAILAALFILGRALLKAPGSDEAELTPTQEEALVVNTLPEDRLPAKLLIPKLDVESDVQRLGITKTGNMAAPNNFTDVSWYKYGTVPGQVGSAVMAGHVDNALDTPAIFYELPKLEIGDDIYVVQEGGERLHFRVIDKQIYRYDNAPAEKIFNNSSGRYLNLITCQGKWVPAAKSAENRLVIYTELVEE